MAKTDADGITRKHPAPVLISPKNDQATFDSTRVSLDHRGFWITDDEDEESVCIAYVDIPSLLDALEALGLIKDGKPCHS